MCAILYGIGSRGQRYFAAFGKRSAIDAALRRALEPGIAFFGMALSERPESTAERPYFGVKLPKGHRKDTFRK
jgi:hypothetical protein